MVSAHDADHSAAMTEGVEGNGDPVVMKALGKRFGWRNDLHIRMSSSLVDLLVS
jgi:hypothetical protein